MKLLWDAVFGGRRCPCQTAAAGLSRRVCDLHYARPRKRIPYTFSHLPKDMANTATSHIVFGTQGAGKTSYSRKLAASENAVRFSIDEWMIELFGPDMPKSLSLSWIMPRVQRCEAKIWSIASQIGGAGGSVVLDLGFMRIEDRRRFAALASESGMASQLHFVDAPHATRRTRVSTRNQERGETFAFEVTPGMFDFMETRFESPTATELAGAVCTQSA